MTGFIEFSITCSR